MSKRSTITEGKEKGRRGKMTMERERERGRVAKSVSGVASNFGYGSSTTFFFLPTTGFYATSMSRLKTDRLRRATELAKTTPHTGTLKI